MVGGKIYLCGGGTGTAARLWHTNTVAIYDPAANRWSTGPSLPEPVTSGLSIAAGNALFYIGGQTGVMDGDRLGHVFTFTVP